jgi:DnaJ-class molecular chaperone
MKSPYEILGVDKSATPDQIKKKYKSLCGKYHPDKGGDEQKFKEVQDAYKRLTEPEKFRAEEQHNPFTGFKNNSFFHMPVQVTLPITLEEVFNGCSKIIKINGEEIRIPIAKGTDPTDGFTGHIRLNSGEQVLLMCQLQLTSHPEFTLEPNSNLICHKQITLLEYYNGTTIKITDLAGKTYAVKIKPQTNNQSIRVPGKGFPKGNHFGDIIINLSVELPVLTESKINNLGQLLAD